MEPGKPVIRKSKVPQKGTVRKDWKTVFSEYYTKSYF